MVAFEDTQAMQLKTGRGSTIAIPILACSHGEGGLLMSLHYHIAPALHNLQD